MDEPVVQDSAVAETAKDGQTSSAGTQVAGDASDASGVSVPDRAGRFAAGNPYRWLPGQSGNPGGRRKGASFAAALARQAVAPVFDREEMAKIARTIGLDPQEARNIDVVAALFYVALCRLLVRASGNNGRVDERLMGMLQVLLKALDPAELRVSGPDGGPIPIAAVVANVQTALGMRPAEISGAVHAGHSAVAEDSDEVPVLADTAISDPCPADGAACDYAVGDAARDPAVPENPPDSA